MKKSTKVERARKKLEKFKSSKQKGKCPICIKKFDVCKHTEEQAIDKLYSKLVTSLFGSDE
jgi:hypothetical protein